MSERVVGLIDMDCFYCQVESRLDPELKGKPMAVVQYNSWKGGGIIAVNYEARDFGVTRNMRGDQAKEKCPEIILVKVPEVRGKADLSKYRDAGREVIEVLLTFGAVVERASVDEAYIDLTKLVDEKLDMSIDPDQHLSNTHLAKQPKDAVKDWVAQATEVDHRLAVGAVIVEQMRAAVYEKTQFRCSAGIAHNKMLAKLACGLNKPNKQTVLPQDEQPELFSTLKLTKLRGLGGKLGDAVKEHLHCETVGDLSRLSVNQFKAFFDDKTSRWLYDMARGLDHEPVKERDLPKSIGCGKNFRGPEILDTKKKVEHWMSQLCEELVERLNKDKEDNKRLARSLHVSVTQDATHTSRAGPLKASFYDTEQIAKQFLSMIAKTNESTDGTSWIPKLRNITISATKFEELSKFSNTSSITNFFGKSVEEPKQSTTVNEESEPPKVCEDAESSTLHEVTDEDSRHSSVADPPETLPEVELVQCDRCDKMVSPFELPEHLDFHVARDLYENMKREDQAQRTVTPVPVVTAKRKSKTTSKEPSPKKQRNITAFFTKK